jgi:hypothetical protein
MQASIILVLAGVLLVASPGHAFVGSNMPLSLRRMSNNQHCVQMNLLDRRNALKVGCSFAAATVINISRKISC